MESALSKIACDSSSVAFGPKCMVPRQILADVHSGTPKLAVLLVILPPNRFSMAEPLVLRHSSESPGRLRLRRHKVRAPVDENAQLSGREPGRERPNQVGPNAAVLVRRHVVIASRESASGRWRLSSEPYAVGRGGPWRWSDAALARIRVRCRRRRRYSARSGHGGFGEVGFSEVSSGARTCGRSESERLV